MYENLQNIEELYRFINVHDLAVVHIMRDNCTVCHAVLPQIQDLLKDYPKAQLGVINQSNVEEIAGELSIFTVPVDLIFFNGKEMHRQARFIDMQSFEKQLYIMQNAID